MLRCHYSYWMCKSHRGDYPGGNRGCREEARGFIWDYYQACVKRIKLFGRLFDDGRWIKWFKGIHTYIPKRIEKKLVGFGMNCDLKQIVRTFCTGSVIIVSNGQTIDIIESIKSMEHWLHLRKIVPLCYVTFPGIHRNTQIIVMWWAVELYFGREMKQHGQEKYKSVLIITRETILRCKLWSEKGEKRC